MSKLISKKELIAELESIQDKLCEIGAGCDPAMFNPIDGTEEEQKEYEELCTEDASTGDACFIWHQLRDIIRRLKQRGDTTIS